MQTETYFDIALRVSALAGSLFTSVMLFAAFLYKKVDNHWDARASLISSDMIKRRSTADVELKWQKNEITKKAKKSGKGVSDNNV